MAKQIKPVIKPYLMGSWHGKYAFHKGVKMTVSILFISFIYVLLGLMLSFDSLALRVITSTILIVFAASYMFFQGANSGEADTAFSEIMYTHEQDGKAVVAYDRERCYHPGKGFYEVLIGLIPYLLITLVFAVLAQPLTYTLGVLPGWLLSSSAQSHVGEALQYYEIHNISAFMTVLRVVARVITMPFINIALLLDVNTVLWTERLTPLWVSIAPLAYAFGYLQGPAMRIKVNTGIKIGVHKKKRKERKAQKARTANNRPKQLV